MCLRLPPLHRCPRLCPCCPRRFTPPSPSRDPAMPSDPTSLRDREECPVLPSGASSAAVSPWSPSSFLSCSSPRAKRRNRPTKSGWHIRAARDPSKPPLASPLVTTPSTACRWHRYRHLCPTSRADPCPATPSGAGAGGGTPYRTTPAPRGRASPRLREGDPRFRDDPRSRDGPRFPPAGSHNCY